MGNKIKVELSHGGGRAAKFNAEPGACFRCGQQGHWARCVEQMYLSILYITAHYSRECPSGHGMWVFSGLGFVTSYPLLFIGRTIGVDFTILPWSIVSREIIIVHVDLRLGMTIFVSHSSHLGTRVITTLPLLEGLLRLEITGTMVLRCLALVILMTIDAVLHLRTGTGTPRSHRHRPRRKSIEVAFLLMILVIAVAMVMPHIRLLRHPMIGMTIEEVIVTEITFHCLPEVALHLVVGMTLIGCLRGKLLATWSLPQEAKSEYYLGSMLTTVAGHRLHHVILILVGRLNPRQDIGKHFLQFEARQSLTRTHRRRSESPRSATYEYPPNGYGGTGPGPSSGPPSLPLPLRGNPRDYNHPSRNGRDHPEPAGGYRRS